jgi:hypothetical protein
LLLLLLLCHRLHLLLSPLELLQRILLLRYQLTLLLLLLLLLLPRHLQSRHLLFRHIPRAPHAPL